MQIAKIKFNLANKDEYIQVADEVKVRDSIVIESPRGTLIATVLQVGASDKEIDSEIKYIRLATADDLNKYNTLKDKARDVKASVIECVAKYNSDMKVVDIEYTLDGNKIIISYVCEDRVDFRDLVKELASELKLRIELRQIGIRDQAKCVGCIGVCGKECCCKQYLNDFDKVSIKMAKTQNLSLNPTKISGTCGRLMCCLAFENDTYSELGKNCPKCGACVSTPDGDGTVINNNILKQTSLCRVEKGEDIKISEYSVADIKEKHDNRKK